jgi:hypothetical protein
MECLSQPGLRSFLQQHGPQLIVTLREKDFLSFGDSLAILQWTERTREKKFLGCLSLA